MPREELGIKYVTLLSNKPRKILSKETDETQFESEENISNEFKAKLLFLNVINTNVVIS